MTAPTRTIFEINVSNKLLNEPIFVKIAAELNYATQLTSSSHDHNLQNIHNKNAYRKSDGNSRYNKTNRESSDYNETKTHNKSSTSTSNSNSSSYSSSGGGGGKAAALGLFSVGGGGSSSQSNKSSSSSSYHRADDNLKHEISKQDRKALDENATTDYKSDSDLKEESNQSISTNESSASSILNNKAIDPGFVRIAAEQSLPIPVIVENESQVVYITVYITNINTKQSVCLANQLQINRQHIEIKRSNKNNEIIIQPSQQHGTLNKSRDLLVSWGIPEYLCDSMGKCGWHNKSLWDSITEQDLIEMGFKRGHREIFHHEYSKLRMITHRIKKQLTYADLLKAWNIPYHLFDNMKKFGWDDIELWDQINDNDFEKLAFERGHILKFKKHTKNNNHIKQFEQMQHDLNQNKINTIINSEDHEDNDNKSEYDIPNTPTFKVNNHKIYHESFEIMLDTIKKSEIYVVEIDENEGKKWRTMAEISQTKCHRINGLNINTVYSVRIRAQNAFKKRSDYSEVIKIKTKDKKWIQLQNVPIPEFKYNVAFYKNKISVAFRESELTTIKDQTKFNEKYFIEACLNNNDIDDGKNKTFKWNKIGTVNKNTLSYGWDINKNVGKSDVINIRVSSLNDLSYCQHSSFTKHIINEIHVENTLAFNPKHIGDNVQYIGKNKVKLKKGSWSTFSFGVPIGHHLCNKYNIYFKLNSWLQFAIGYCTSDDDLKSQSHHLGYSANKNSVGLYRETNNCLSLYDKKNYSKKLTDQIPSLDSKNDTSKIFISSFDFINGYYCLYLNDTNNQLVKIKLQDDKKVVIPSFSAALEDCVIEIIKWELH